MNIWRLDYGGPPFVFLGAAHLTTLTLILGLNALFVVWRGRASLGTRTKCRYTLAGILLVNEAVWHLWNYATGQWSVQTMLPLHLCSVMVFVGAAALITKNQRLYELLYFLGIGGAFQALMTPDVGRYGFPHYRFFASFLSHGLILSAPIYLTLVERLRPTWGSLRRAFVAVNVYMVLVGGVNWLIGSNYLYIARKPDTASLLDALGPWPWYIAGMEVMALACMLLLYMPFAIRDRPDGTPAGRASGER